MHQVLATLHVFGLRAADRVRARVAGDSERGNVTIEQVLWAVAVTVIVAIVVAAVKSYVQSESAKISPSSF
ncbi:hypothetical protein [Myceligenerans indicum]|uniref:Integral membrane protein n=1 Tax=Myceligenerans indicum TaxID=2593663 RepID=A0ABS1LF13_9MICO|nr:hypothetical protein [Myceligenerans indicum]MBL0884847.1 hypothetical protein [Myceligenerans indicum]